MLPLRFLFDWFRAIFYAIDKMRVCLPTNKLLYKYTKRILRLDGMQRVITGAVKQQQVLGQLTG